MKRRNFIAAAVAAVVTPVTSIAAVTTPTAIPRGPLISFTDEMQWERNHRKVVNNSMHGAYGQTARGMTTSVFIVDESPFLPS